ncbi:histidine phosphatase family protein [Marinospirillum perlucidum]|uniref:histidine phosphatase family protein n=1 Tax=Marinospirillum perlucidum TaxID=1982602 RepID=UPI000DF37E3E|nr:histidine phosphatase family protein [Marinospirillum perlucidum]
MNLTIWRHPKPRKSEGICLGHTDLDVDPRRSRRLASRIQHYASLQGCARQLHVSPLQRSWKVGQLLEKKGWALIQDPRLIEFDFGNWDGRPWQTIPPEEMDAWCENFPDYAPGGGESLRQLFARVESWLSDHQGEACLAVGHAGWITAARLLAAGRSLPQHPDEWLPSLKYSQKLVLPSVELKK